MPLDLTDDKSTLVQVLIGSLLMPYSILKLSNLANNNIIQGIVHRDYSSINLLFITGDFTFTSRRHHGYPFSLTFYINGVLDCRLSTCCEYKHQRGARIGGRAGHFALIGVEGVQPCYKWGKKGGPVPIWDICPKLILDSYLTKASFVQKMHFSCQIILKIYTEHGSYTAMLCAKFQNTLTTKW